MIEYLMNNVKDRSIGGKLMLKRLMFCLTLVMVLLVVATPAFAGRAPKPLITITSPSDRSVVSGSSVLIAAECDSGGSDYTITKVKFKIDGSKAKTTMSGPDGSRYGTWTANWDSTVVADGSHTITVTAWNSGKKWTSKLVIVTANNQVVAPSPTVGITSPANGDTVAGSITMSAICGSGGSGNTVSSVQYVIDGGSSVAMSGPNGSVSGTWTANWNSSTVADGLHTITVTAMNSAGKTLSSTIIVTVNNASPHAALVWSDYPMNCLNCHRTKFNEMYQSVHYQWQGNAPDMTNQPNILQGKITNSVNSYCINILGNWTVCGKCHTGRKDKPVATSTPTDAQLLNIDCLVCHNEPYMMVRTRLSDGTMGAPASTAIDTLNSYVRSIQKPTKANCLKCHAYAGGGDAYKRGDLAWATRNTADHAYDAHMATTGANLACQDCHTFVNHKVTGKGSDLRATDYASEIKCSKCHTSKESSTGHSTSKINTHVARLACQTCHIPTYGKNASDSAATEATEIHRDWTDTSKHVPGQTPYHPGITAANNLMPKYKFWNRKSNNYLLGNTAVLDQSTGAYPTSRPVGSVNDPLGTKLYPFKYKTAKQPLRTANNVLIAVDTFEYQMLSGDPILATQKGLANMGYSSTDPFQWVLTDTYQLLNHQVAPKTGVLQCADCHGSTTRMDLKGTLGYTLKGPSSTVCTQCHGSKSIPSFTTVHSKHVDSLRYDCSFCHAFSRPERGLKTTR